MGGRLRDVGNGSGRGWLLNLGQGFPARNTPPPEAVITIGRSVQAAISNFLNIMDLRTPWASTSEVEVNRSSGGRLSVLPGKPRREPSKTKTRAKRWRTTPRPLTMTSRPGRLPANSKPVRRRPAPSRPAARVENGAYLVPAPAGCGPFPLASSGEWRPRRESDPRGSRGTTGARYFSGSRLNSSWTISAPSIRSIVAGASLRSETTEAIACADWFVRRSRMLRRIALARARAATRAATP